MQQRPNSLLIKLLSRTADLLGDGPEVRREGHARVDDGRAEEGGGEGRREPRAEAEGDGHVDEVWRAGEAAGAVYEEP